MTHRNARYTFSDTQYVSFIFLVVALYWIVQFLLAVEEFLVASCVTIWYVTAASALAFFCIVSGGVFLFFFWSLRGDTDGVVPV